jgi:hypothetical protein
LDPAAPTALVHLAVVVSARAVADRREDVLEAEALGKDEEVVEVVADTRRLSRLDAGSSDSASTGASPRKRSATLPA